MEIGPLTVNINTSKPHAAISKGCLFVSNLCFFDGCVFVCVVFSVTLLWGRGGDSRLAEAVLLSLGELRRRLGRVLPWSQLDRERQHDRLEKFRSILIIMKRFVPCFQRHNIIIEISLFVWDFYYLPPALCSVGDLIGRDSQVGQDLSDPSGVHATVRSYIGLTPSVHIHLTHCVATQKH